MAAADRAVVAIAGACAGAAGVAGAGGAAGAAPGARCARAAHLALDLGLHPCPLGLGEGPLPLDVHASAVQRDARLVHRLPVDEVVLAADAADDHPPPSRHRQAADDALLHVDVGGRLVDVHEQRDVGAAAERAQVVERLELQVGVALAPRHVGQQRLRARRRALREDEQAAFLQLRRGRAGEQLFDHRDGLLRVAHHQAVQRDQLQLFVTRLVGRHRLARRLPHVDHQRLGVVAPAARRELLLQFLDGPDRLVSFPETVKGVRLPVHRAIHLLAVLDDHLLERLEGTIVTARVEVRRPAIVVRGLARAEGDDLSCPGDRDVLEVGQERFGEREAGRRVERQHPGGMLERRDVERREAGQFDTERVERPRHVGRDRRRHGQCRRDGRLRRLWGQGRRLAGGGNRDERKGECERWASPHGRYLVPMVIRGSRPRRSPRGTPARGRCRRTRGP